MPVAVWPRFQGAGGISMNARLLSWQAGLMFPLVEWSLRRHGYTRTRARLEWLAPRFRSGAIPEQDPLLVTAIATAVDDGNKHISVYPALCLTRALLLSFFLQRHGQDAQIRLGVRTLMGHFQAHAWVESEGMEVNEPEPAAQLYQPFDWTNQAGLNS